MAYAIDGLRQSALSRPIALILAALALASGSAAWMADVGPAIPAFTPSKDPSPFAPSKYTSSFFNDRFYLATAPQSASPHRPLIGSLPPELEIKLQQAKGLLAEKL